MLNSEEGGRARDTMKQPAVGAHFEVPKGLQDRGSKTFLVLVEPGCHFRKENDIINSK